MSRFASHSTKFIGGWNMLMTLRPTVCPPFSEPLVPSSTRAGQGRLVADEGGVVVEQVDPPPAGIAAEEGDITADLLNEVGMPETSSANPKPPVQ